MKLANFARLAVAAGLVAGQIAIVGAASAASSGTLPFNPSSIPGVTVTTMPNGAVLYTKNVNPSAINGTYSTGSSTTTVGASSAVKR